ncbi:MAG: hypothetical protein H3C43_03550 [Leptonema sp. (in: Bacteria)]|nr:hypothetical protein [Leptonema sp. (in: bacteria)]
MSANDINSQEIGYLLDFYIEVEEDSVRSQIRDRLLSRLPFGCHPIQFIEKIGCANTRCQLREKALADLNDNKIIYDLNQLQLSTSLESISYLTSRLSESDIVSYDEFVEKLDRLAEPLIRKINSNSKTNATELDTLIQYLFVDQGFQGNTEDFYFPPNNYLTHVLESRVGIPVSLSVLTLLVGRRAGLDLDGINLPGHFIVVYRTGSIQTYFDPFNEGALLSEEDCTRYMIRQGIAPDANFLKPADNFTIMRRIYQNLISYYSNSKDRKKEATLNRHLAILNNKFCTGENSIR